jgi:DNA-nicking Smr family endonuclease
MERHVVGRRSQRPTLFTSSTEWRPRAWGEAPKESSDYGEHLITTRRARVKLKLDLHDIYNRGGDIDRALRAIIDEAIEKKVRLVEIIPGKGSGQLKKRVLRFLDQKEIKELYDRVEKDSKNFGRVFVHFRFK